LPLNEIIEPEDEGDRQQEHGRGVGNDEEGGCDSQEASDPASKNHRHRRVQNINIFAESVQDSGRHSSIKWDFLILNKFVIVTFQIKGDTSRCQFHQHFIQKFLYKIAFFSFSLVTV